MKNNLKKSKLLISQKFGIKLRHLHKRNNWKDGYRPKEGEKIYLKGKRK